MKNGRKKIILNKQQADYLRANYKTLSTAQIGLDIGVSKNLVTVSILRLGLEVPKKEEMVIDFVNGVWSDELHRELFHY